MEVLCEERFARYPPFRPEPDLTSVREAVALLQAALRPVMVSGGSVRPSGGGVGTYSTSTSSSW